MNQDPYVIPDAQKIAFDTRYQTRDGVGGSSTAAAAAVRNLVINGGFRFAQAQVPGTLTAIGGTGTRILTADMWSAILTTAGLQYQRIDTLTSVESNLATRFYGKFKKITGSGKFVVCHCVEGHNIMGVRGKSVQLAAKMRYSAGAGMTVRMALVQLTSAGTIDTIPSTFYTAIGANGVDPTWGTNLAAITPDSASGATISGAGASCVLTSAWVKYIANFTVPADCKNLVAVFFTDSAASVNDEFCISEVDLKEGTVARNWEERNYGEEQALCQRYYQKSFAIDTAPIQNAGAGTGEVRFMAGKVGALAEVSPSYVLPVPMRAAAIVKTTYNPAAASAEVRDFTGAANCTATAIVMNNENSIYFTATGAAGTAVGNHLGIHYTLNAQL